MTEDGVGTAVLGIGKMMCWRRWVVLWRAASRAGLSWRLRVVRRMRVDGGRGGIVVCRMVVFDVIGIPLKIECNNILNK